MSDVLETDPSLTSKKLDVEQAVRARYSAASQTTEASLCCPVEYDTKYLNVIPREVIERDYGCGDPSRYLQPGETVLDLGSGSGKICYIASQIVGAEGRVLGVDMNDDMLQLARGYRQEIGDRIGHHNVEFYKGRIQDLALDLDRFETYLAHQPISQANQWLEAKHEADRMRSEHPMIASDSVDVIVSNCVLNLVSIEARQKLFSEMHRVLRCGGRAVLSDIVSDEIVPETLRQDANLWSGCMSGAFVEDEFLNKFKKAGFYGIEIIARQEQPWATVKGIEFRSITVRAFKGPKGPRVDCHQAVIYKGPWQSVQDDNGHTLQRGQRTAVCDKTFQIYTQPPYADHVIPVPPYQQVQQEEAIPYDRHRGEVRHPRQTKGLEFRKTQLPVVETNCDDGSCC